MRHSRTKLCKINDQEPLEMIFVSISFAQTRSLIKVDNCNIKSKFL